MDRQFSQLPLSMGSSFTYRPEHFVEHSGVTHIADYLAAMEAGTYRAVSIVGAARSGKTHLGFYALDRLIARGFTPVLRVAPDLRRLEIREGDSAPALCIDDAQNILSSDELVSAFVSLYEQVRQSSGVVLLLTDRPLESPNPHLNSRLASLIPLQIGSPGRDDVQSLLLAIAKQRGLKLKSRDRLFLEKRLSPDISALEEYVERLLQISSVKEGRIQLETLKDAI